MKNALQTGSFLSHSFVYYLNKTVTLFFLFVFSVVTFSQKINSVDEVAKWNFVTDNITVNGSVTTVTDQSGSSFIGTLMYDAKIRTIGSSTKYNVLDLGNGTGYFDMGTEIGKDIYTLSNYTVGVFFRVDETNSDLSSTGNCLWTFSNSANIPIDKNGYIFGSLRNQSQHITPGYWLSGEQILGKESYNPAPPAKNGWHHMAYTQNGTVGIVYIDGAQIATASITNLPSVVLPKSGLAGTPFNWIGRSCYPGDAYLKKTLVYGFSLYRVALSADDMTNFLNVPTIISNLNNAYAQDSGSNVSNLTPNVAGPIFGASTVSQDQNSVIYTVSAISNATSYIWTLPTGATGTSSSDTISVNYSKSAISGNITVRGHNEWGDGVASTLAITVNQLPVVAVSDTAKNCIDTLILSAKTATPLKISFYTLGYGSDDIELAVFAEDSTTMICHFIKHVVADTDTTIYLGAGKYYLAWLNGGALLKNPELSGDGINIGYNGWIGMSNYIALPFKVIDKIVVCDGQVLLDANTYYTGTGKLKYKWTPSTGLNNDTISNPIATVTNNTSFNVTATSPNGCTASVDLIVNVAPLTANAGFDKTIVCGGTAQFSSVTTNYTGTGKLKYKWTPTTGLNNDTIVNPTAKVSSDITYYVTVTSPSGCTAIDSVKVLIIPLSVNTGADKQIVCGGTTQLNNVITNFTGTGKLKYKWIPSTGLNNDTIVNPIAKVTDDVIYHVTVTSPEGCTASDSVKVLMTPLVANAGGDTVLICGNSIGLFSYVNYTGSGTLKYKWIPSTGLNNDTIAGPICSATSKTIYTVTISTPDGCSASANVTVSMLAMQQPEIGIVGINSSNKNRIVWNKPISTGIESYFIYKETNASNVYEKIGSVPYDSLSVFVDSLSFPNIKSNKYKLAIFDRNGLESAQSYPHKTMHLSINRGQNNSWNLIWEPYEGFNVSTYNIYRGTNTGNLNFVDATSGSSSQFSDATAPTGDVYYQLEVISPNLINPTKVTSSIQKSKGSESNSSFALVSYNSSRSNIATNVLDGISEYSGGNNNINIYPNPVKDELRIEFAEGTTFEILNLMGQSVYNGNLVENTIVRTSNFSSGVYLIKFKTGKYYEYRKIIKE